LEASGQLYPWGRNPGTHSQETERDPELDWMMWKGIKLCHYCCCSIIVVVMITIIIIIIISAKKNPLLTHAYLIPVALGPGVYSVSNRNEYQKHKNNVSGE
jgi:hypothetical protein